MAGDSCGRAKRRATEAAGCGRVTRGSHAETPATETPREWLVTNGLGGYAAATISGAITRRYHGFLIAALPPPLGRMVVLSDFDVEIERADGALANLRE